ncbi:hypothetical protein KSF_111810 [Reticulibacter mediterranei]|uniref:Uncharacterized protein n=1 Tax=Reticulibacter mediterranei TaxID=2778369 RepID=A0A8J3IUY3_9CHLR|nr:hypothetical protein [Reticulibacter mediterranei]GHP01134.1 hypothetical protein KSF_111810 [Reticulibacter mediterranei]
METLYADAYWIHEESPGGADLPSGLVNISYQVGSALGLAVMIAVSTATTISTLSEGIQQIVVLNSGFHTAFLGAALIAVVGAPIGPLLVAPAKNGRDS